MFSSRPEAEAVIAWRDNAAVGFALYFQSFSTFVGRPGLYLEDLFVRPVYRRRGIGRQLLAHLAQLAVARGCGRFEWSVLTWNKLAIGIYEKLGASPMNDWTVYRLSGNALSALASETRPT
jgi:GNAT superfamily N-acetyltransferase